MLFLLLLDMQLVVMTTNPPFLQSSFIFILELYILCIKEPCWLVVSSDISHFSSSTAFEIMIE